MNSLNPLCTMKTNKLIAAALLPLLFSCAKENIAPADKNAAEGNYVTINLAPDSDAVTRATFDDSKGIIWQPGVKAGLIKEATDWKPVESVSLAEKKIYDYEDPNNKYIKSWQASFEFNLAKSDYTGSYKFFYPYHSEAAYTGDYIRIPFCVDPNQSSGVGKSIDVFAVVSKDMVTLDSNNHDTPAVTYYKVVGSYIRFLVYGKAGEKVKSISIQSEQTPSGMYYVNGNTNELNGEAYTDYSKLVTVSVNGDYTTPATKSDAKGIYASVLPERSLKNTYTVLTDKGLYEFKSEKDVKFEFGSIKDVPLNLQHAKCKYLPIPDDLYIVGDGCEAGWNSSKAITMDKSGNTFTKELYLRNGEGIEGIKFLTTNSNMYPAYVNDGNGNLAYYSNDLGVSNPVDQKFNVKSGFGYYKVTVDFDTNKVSFELLSTPWLVGMKNWDKGQELKPVEEKPGVFSIKTEIWNDNGGMKFVIRKPSELESNIDYPNTYQLRAASTNPIDFASKRYGDVKYDGTTYKLSEKETLTKDVNVTLWGPSNNAFGIDHSSDDNKLYLASGYYKRIYNITLDMNNLKVTISPAHGTEYRLVGINDKWASSDDLPKATAVEGIVKWEGINVNTTAKGFKICGEYTFDNVYTGGSFYDGEWYYASLSFDKKWEDNKWNDNYYWFTPTHSGPTDVVFENTVDRKWYIPESGTYDFEFDTKNLTLKVTKK